ncbi:hypothetical protein [Tautonia sociabilis]|uniref:Uncharacterized protein n=1 Tax=Tautonia sociabilis TaxID=2080755 RepID=A0A432MIE4_9BACT|nr:hypothetical protein [Tautonia sociabilis]RUL86916.1 hypothetical protein TsocGM_14825 [Tautonia sociabilis]
MNGGMAMEVRFSFDRVAETVGLIARHPDYPGKDRVIASCFEEVEELAKAGRITAEQRETLREILGVGGRSSC